MSGEDAWSLASNLRLRAAAIAERMSDLGALSEEGRAMVAECDPGILYRAADMLTRQAELISHYKRQIK